MVSACIIRLPFRAWPKLSTAPRCFSPAPLPAFAGEVLWLDGTSPASTRCANSVAWPAAGCSGLGRPSLRGQCARRIPDGFSLLNIRLRPCSDLVEMIDAVLVELFLVDGANALDERKIIGLAAARTLSARHASAALPEASLSPFSSATASSASCVAIRSAGSSTPGLSAPSIRSAISRHRHPDRQQ